MNIVRDRELLGNLKAGVASADDENRALGKVIRIAVFAAVQLDDTRVELVGNWRHPRDLKRARGHNDLLGLVGALVGFEDVRVNCSAERMHSTTKLNRQVELAGVLGE